MSDENVTPEPTEADVDPKTEAEHQAEHQAEAEPAPVTPQQQNFAVGISVGTADPPSPLLDSTDGGSTWDAAAFVAPRLEEMPTEGPGSPGYDVYNPNNEPPRTVKYEAHDDEDVKAALERETQDGLGETPEEHLPDTDVDPNAELAEDYVDLMPAKDDTAPAADAPAEAPKETA